MLKRVAIGTVAVFVIWSACDYLIHGVLLKNAYLATIQLWRPETEMKLGLMRVVTFLAAAAFTLLYALLISPKNMKTALIYGALFGFVSGVTMGYGSYAVMPITYPIAITWFLGMIIEALLGAAALAVIVGD